MEPGNSPETQGSLYMVDLHILGEEDGAETDLWSKKLSVPYRKGARARGMDIRLVKGCEHLGTF